MRRVARDLNLSAAKLHLFGVNTILAARMSGFGTQAQNAFGAAQSVSTNPSEEALQAGHIQAGHIQAEASGLSSFSEVG